MMTACSCPVQCQSFDWRRGTLLAKWSRYLINQNERCELLIILLDSDEENEQNSEDDESVDIELLLHNSNDFSEPPSTLWGSYPRHSSEDSDGSDDADSNAAVNDRRVNIPISWLRSGFMLSKCGNGLAVLAPSDDEWGLTHRRRLSNCSMLRDGPLKGVRGLFPYNCKGVSAMLSIIRRCSIQVHPSRAGRQWRAMRTASRLTNCHWNSASASLNRGWSMRCPH